MPYDQEETKNLFDSIDSVSKDQKQALEDFKKALQSADVNEFDMDGNTPLICVVNARIEYLNNETEKLSALKEMLTLLTQHKSININLQSIKQAYTRKQKTDGKTYDIDNEVFSYLDREITRIRECYQDQGINKITDKYVYYGTREEVIFTDEPNFSCSYDVVYEEVKKLDSEGKPIYVGNTALHVAFTSEDEEAISILYTNPNIKDNIQNHEGIRPEEIIPNKIQKLR